MSDSDSPTDSTPSAADEELTSGCANQTAAKQNIGPVSFSRL